jgi:hypothetical protein
VGVIGNPVLARGTFPVSTPFSSRHETLPRTPISEPGCTPPISGLHHFWALDPGGAIQLVLGSAAKTSVCPR